MTVPWVVRSDAGAAVMIEVAEAVRLVVVVMAAVPVTLTVRWRRGCRGRWWSLRRRR